MAECIDIQADLSAYLDGELPAQDRSALDAHLRACDACRRVLEDLRGVSTVVAELPRAKAPASLIEKLRKDIANEPQLREQTKAAVSFTSAPRAGIRPRVHWVPFAMGAAALVLLCVLAFLVLPAMSKNHTEGEVALHATKAEASPAAKAEQPKDGELLRVEDESKWKDKQAAPIERSLKKVDGKAAPSDAAASGRVEAQKDSVDALAKDRGDKPNEFAKSADEPLRSRSLAKSDDVRPAEKAAVAAVPTPDVAGGRADAAGKGSQQGNFGAQANGATGANAERDVAKRRMSTDKAAKEPVTADAKGEALAGAENRAKREENTYRANDPARAATLQNKDEARRKQAAGEEAPRLEAAQKEKKELSDAKALKETQQAEQLEKSVPQQQLESKAAENRKEAGVAFEGKDQNAGPAREQEKSVAAKKPSDPGDGRGAGIGGGAGNPPKPEAKAATVAAAPAGALPPAPPGAALAKPAGNANAISKTIVFRTKDPQRLSQELKKLVESSGARWEDVAAKGKNDAPAEKLAEAKAVAGQGGAKSENYQIVASANQRDGLLAKLQQYEALQRQDRVGATGADKKTLAEGGDKFKNAPAQEAAELEETKKKSKAEPEAPKPTAPAKKAAPLPDADADQLHDGAEVRIQILIIAE